MRRAFNWFMVLVFVCGLLAAMSYAGARATTGKVVGSNPPLSNRTVTLAYKGVPELPGNPRAWVVRYGRTRLPGVPRAVIYVSLTGKLIAMRPTDLDEKLIAWEKAQEP
jgi:hypothetical protein